MLLRFTIPKDSKSIRVRKLSIVLQKQKQIKLYTNMKITTKIEMYFATYPS